MVRTWRAGDLKTHLEKNLGRQLTETEVLTRKDLETPFVYQTPILCAMSSMVLESLCAGKSKGTVVADYGMDGQQIPEESLVLSAVSSFFAEMGYIDTTCRELRSDLSMRAFAEWSKGDERLSSFFTRAPYFLRISVHDLNAQYAEISHTL